MTENLLSVLFLSRAYAPLWFFETSRRRLLSTVKSRIKRKVCHWQFSIRKTKSLKEQLRHSRTFKGFRWEFWNFSVRATIFGRGSATRERKGYLCARSIHSIGKDPQTLSTLCWFPCKFAPVFSAHFSEYQPFKLIEKERRARAHCINFRHFIFIANLCQIQFCYFWEVRGNAKLSTTRNSLKIP